MDARKFLLYVNAFARAFLKLPIWAIFLVIIILIAGVDSLIPSPKSTTPVAAQKESPQPPDYAKQRLEKAHRHWPEIEEMVKNHCKHPLTAEVSRWSANWMPMDSTAENVVFRVREAQKTPLVYLMNLPTPPIYQLI